MPASDPLPIAPALPIAPHPRARGAGFAARLLTSDVLRRVMRERRTLDEAFAIALPAVRQDRLPEADQALARAIVTIAFRRMGTIRAAIAARLHHGALPEAGLLETALIIGATQLLFMDVPDHAAVDLAVALTKSDPLAKHYAPLANAILRKIAAEKAEILSAALETTADTPPWMRTRWARAYGAETAEAIARIHASPPSIDLTAMGDIAALHAAIGGTLLPTGSLRLATDAPIASLPGYAEGLFQVQDVASALPARLMGAKPGQRVLDLCAAPGGKTAQLAKTGACVVAVERSAQRAERLTINLARLQLDAELIIGDAATYSGTGFDAVLLDAPCSATGTIRRHPEIAWTKTLADILTLAVQQEKLLLNAAGCVKIGGMLVYATCSLEQEEGERQIDRFLSANAGFKLLPISADELGIAAESLTEDGMLRVLPAHFADFGGADGFFAARMQRLS